MTFPRLPLEAEFVEALRRLPEFATQEDVQKLRRKFTELRDRMFPGWFLTWHRDVEAWAKADEIVTLTFNR